VKPGNAERGTISISALVALLLLAALGAGAAALLRSLQSYERRSVERAASRAGLERAAREIVAELERDPTPEADSPVDPVWAAVRLPREDGLMVELADVSSALHANWVQKNILAKTRLAELFRSGSGPDQLQQRREDRGFSTDIVAGYGDLFQEGILEKYFSGYGYANVNTTDEFALRKLYLLRTGDAEGAEEFHSRIQGILTARRILKPEELAGFLGAAYPALAPMVNAEAGLNVHYLDPYVLGELLAYPDWHVEHPDAVSRSFLERRQSSELTAQELKRIIGPAGDGRIYQYLGVTTWFWRVSVSRGTERLDFVVARLPRAEKEEASRLLVVEERYVR